MINTQGGNPEIIVVSLHATFWITTGDTDFLIYLLSLSNNVVSGSPVFL